jgi:hypothetical protein
MGQTSGYALLHPRQLSVVLGQVAIILGLGACKPSGDQLIPEDPRRSTSTDAEQQIQADQTEGVIQATLEEVPEGSSRQTRFNFAVGGEQLSHYSYKIGPAVTTECGLATGYETKAIGEPIQADISDYPDGEIVLCVLAQHENGDWQPFEAVTRFSWIKETGPLEAPTELQLTSADEQMGLAWQPPEGASGFLVVRSETPVAWVPEDGQEYEPGELADGSMLVAKAEAAEATDSGLLNRSSYYYAIFAHDVEFRYSPAVTGAGIPAAKPYAWIDLEPDAYLENAVAGGTRYDGSRFLYLCRAERLDQNGQVQGYHPGKFVPVAKDDLSSGDCYYGFGQGTSVERENVEILVITRGAFDDWFTWMDTSAADGIGLNAFVAGVENETRDLYACRYPDGPNDYRVPGKTFVTSGGCHADVFSLKGLRIEADAFQILTLKQQ